MTPDTVDVKLSGLTVRVPTRGKPERSQQIADSVNARIQQIEKTSFKVNTQAFALQAAYEFAADLDQLKIQIANEQETAAMAIQQLSDQVRALRADIEESGQS